MTEDFGNKKNIFWYKDFFDKWYFKMPHVLVFDPLYIKKEVIF